MRHTKSYLFSQRALAITTIAALSLGSAACGDSGEGTSEASGISGAEMTVDASTTDAAASSDSSDSSDSSGGSDGSGSSGGAGSTSDDPTQGGDCEPGAQESCYTGPDGTQGVGVCAAGTHTCGDNGSWGPCIGEVLPGNEDCGNGDDDNCNGEIDEDIDADGDGWSACAGDCCDAAGAVCTKPELVNPGAYDVEGNGVDDDCDGDVDEPAVVCDGELGSNSADPLDYARAMDLCQFTEENVANPEDQIWGVIDASFSLADGEGSPKAAQRAIRASFGDNIGPEGGETMAILSSGHAAATGDSNPSYQGFQIGVNHNTSSQPPADWASANGGELPNPPGCQAPGDLSSNDPIMLTLRVRAPTNASSFSAKMFFFSAEFPEWVCSQYNDFFVALVDSEADNNPDDKNIAIWDDGQEHWPVGVNLAKVADGLFTACQNGIIGCNDKDIPESQYSGCEDSSLVLGTGFDELDTGGCGVDKYVGGGTGWLTMNGNVEPGEVFDIRLAIWDSGGHIFDSLVLLDDWRWSVEAAEPGLEPPQ